MMVMNMAAGRPLGLGLGGSLAEELLGDEGPVWKAQRGHAHLRGKTRRLVFGLVLGTAVQKYRQRSLFVFDGILSTTGACFCLVSNVETVCFEQGQRSM